MRTLAVLSLLSAAAAASPQGWHRSKDDGIEAARKSGKPVLVVTLWKEGV